MLTYQLVDSVKNITAGASGVASREVSIPDSVYGFLVVAVGTGAGFTTAHLTCTVEVGDRPVVNRVPCTILDGIGKHVGQLMRGYSGTNITSSIVPFAEKALTADGLLGGQLDSSDAARGVTFKFDCAASATNISHVDIYYLAEVGTARSDALRTNLIRGIMYNRESVSAGSPQVFDLDLKQLNGGGNVRRLWLVPDANVITSVEYKVDKVDIVPSSVPIGIVDAVAANCAVAAHGITGAHVIDLIPERIQQLAVPSKIDNGAGGRRDVTHTLRIGVSSATSVTVYTQFEAAWANL